MTRVLDDINRMNYLLLLKFLNTSAKGKEEGFISNRQLNSAFKRVLCQVLGTDSLNHASLLGVGQFLCYDK